MKKTIAAAIVALGMSAGLSAVADNQVTKVEGETGSVVIRGSEVIAVTPGLALLSGDRIISAESSALTLSNGECERVFKDASQIVIGEDFCDSKSSATFSAGGDPQLNLDGGPGTLLALLAAGAVAATVIIVAEDDNDDFDPTSP